MKTSINVPDWLHQQVQDANPGVPFGWLVRDALIITLPEWRRNTGTPAALRALRMELRLRTAAEQQQAAAAARAGHRRRPAKPRARRAVQAPATPPKARTSKAGASQPTT